MAEAVESKSLSYFYVPFQFKSKPSTDGSIEVYGKVTGDQLDLDQQVVDKDWARDALGDWFKAAANIRQMHSCNLPPAGKGMELTENEDGFWLRSKIIEPYAVRAIEEGVYTGYSVGIKGPRLQRDVIAKNGRIVGGTIVETSVVDYPCLSSAKFVQDDRAKMAKFVVAKAFRDRQGEQDVALIAKFASPDEVEDTRAKLVNLVDEPEEKTEPEELDEKVAQYAATIEDLKDLPTEKREFTSEQRESMADRGQALPDGSFPIANKTDLSNAIRAIGRASNPAKAKRHIIARARALGATDMLPDDWKKLAQAELRYFVKRAHDAICPGYDLSDVLFAYPELAKDGLAMALGPGVRQQIYQMLAYEVGEDGGTGSSAEEINDLSHSYKLLCAFLYQEALEVAMDGMPAQILADARTDLRKVFAAAHPDLEFKPKVSAEFPAVPGREAGMPGSSESFDGREMTSPGGSASTTIPGASFMLPSGSDSKARGGPPANVDSASTPLPAVPGSEAGMPGASASHGGTSAELASKDARALYDAGARAQVAAGLQSLHDSMSQVTGFECPVVGAGSKSPDMKADAQLVPVTPSPDEVKGTEEESTKEPHVDHVDLSQGLANMVTKADLESTIDEVIARTVKAATKAAEARHAETESELRDQLTDLHRKIQEMETQPDPKAAVIRKAQTTDRPSAANDAHEAAMLEKRAELENEILQMRDLYANASEFATRDWARRQLDRLEQAELLKA